VSARVYVGGRSKPRPYGREIKRGAPTRPRQLHIKGGNVEDNSMAAVEVLGAAYVFVALLVET
jgi:hypothetical protein